MFRIQLNLHSTTIRNAEVQYFWHRVVPSGGYLGGLFDGIHAFRLAIFLALPVGHH